MSKTRLLLFVLLMIVFISMVIQIEPTKSKESSDFLNSKSP